MLSLFFMVFSIFYTNGVFLLHKAVTWISVRHHRNLATSQLQETPNCPNGDKDWRSQQRTARAFVPNSHGSTQSSVVTTSMSDCFMLGFSYRLKAFVSWSQNSLQTLQSTKVLERESERERERERDDRHKGSCKPCQSSADYGNTHTIFFKTACPVDWAASETIATGFPWGKQPRFPNARNPNETIQL